MRVAELLTASERRLALLLFLLTLIGSSARFGRRVSPEIAAWLDGAPSPEIGAQAADPPGDPAAAGGLSGPGDAGAPPANASGPPTPPAAARLPEPVDPNTADADALMALPGIGPAMAGRILEDRAANGPYRTAGDLLRVKGIGPATLARLRPFLSLP